MMTLDELQALTPHFDWARYLTASPRRRFTSINVTEPDFFKAFDAAARRRRRSTTCKTYLRWHLCTRRRDLLPKAFVDENFRFYRTTLHRRARSCGRAGSAACSTRTSDLGEALGKAFVEETFGPQAKADTLKMVHEIEAALEQDIDDARLDDRRDQEGRRCVKLHAVVEQDRLSGQVARLQRALASCAATRSATRSAATRSSSIAQLTEDRQAGRQERVEHDAADGQRVLQPARRTTSTSRPASCSRRSTAPGATRRSTTAAPAP